jgi:hypothetical protein
MWRADYALNLLDEMLQPNMRSVRPMMLRVILMFLRRCRGRTFNEEDIVGLVSKFGEHGVFRYLQT